MQVQILEQVVPENGTAKCSAPRMDQHHNVKENDRYNMLVYERYKDRYTLYMRMELSNVVLKMDQHHSVKEKDPLKHVGLLKVQQLAQVDPENGDIKCSASIMD